MNWIILFYRIPGYREAFLQETGLGTITKQLAYRITSRRTLNNHCA